MGLEYSEKKVDGFEKVLEIKSSESGLHAIIAIHNSTLGPALGGTRIYAYSSQDEAVNDVLRLSEGMTYKAAVAGVGLGGGKSVIIIDPKKGKTKEILRDFARAVNHLNGQYICAEDMGCSLQDVAEIRKETKYVTGIQHEKGSGNPAPFTTWGVIRGLQATMQRIFGDQSFKGKTFAIQGLGSVGNLVAEHLYWSGARLIVSDINKRVLEEAKLRFGAKVVPNEEIFSTECDVFVPCAMGGILNPETIPLLKCRAVVGCANNQLLDDSDAVALKEREILYAPDFVVNAGGLINVSFEINQEGYDPVGARDKVSNIYNTLAKIYEMSEQNGCSTQAAALSLAEYRLKYLVGKRYQKPHFHEMVGIS